LYKSICTANLPAPTVEDGSTAMDVALYTGNGSTQTISGLEFSPDLVWVKMRSTDGYSHKLTDTVRGATKSLVTNNTNFELTETSGLTAFTSDGFSLGSQDPYNRNTDTFVAWTWDAGHPSTPTTGAVSFDGTSDYLTVPKTDAWPTGTQDATIEFFLYRNGSGTTVTLLGKDYSGAGLSDFYLTTSNVLYFYDNNLAADGGTGIGGVTLSTGKWYHIALTRTASTLRLFVDGQIVATKTGVTGNWFDSASFTYVMIGARENPLGNQSLNGFMSNVHVVLGTALYTSNFTRPTAPLTAVANTKLLCCQSSSSATAATVSPGAITANGNASATTKSDSTAANDSLVDVPTNGTETDSGAGGEVRGNYCTLNPLDTDGGTFANGNLELTTSSSGYSSTRSTIAVSSGKWYWEVTFSNNNVVLGIAPSSGARPLVPGNTSTSYAFDCWDGDKRNNDTTSTYASSLIVGDVLGVALDLDNGTLTFYKNGTSLGTAFSSISGTFSPCVADAISAASYLITCNFGQRAFAYSAPSGYKALCTANLPAPTVEDGSTVMDVALYTGNSGTQSVTGLGFSPDFLWFKSRSVGYGHRVFDQVRGFDGLYPNETVAEDTNAVNENLVSYDSNGFTVGTTTGINALNNNNVTMVAWAWDAGSSTVSNTDGSITSSVRANPTAGFSIVTYTASASATIGHGLGVAPSLIIAKSRTSGTTDWVVYSSILGRGKYLLLNENYVAGTLSNYWGTADPTSTVFGVYSTVGASNNAGNMVAYCFAPVEGYSAFGSYTGNGSSDGPFVYTGFRPRWVLIKNASGAANWMLYDTARNTYNTSPYVLSPNNSDGGLTYDAYGGAYPIDILSNGFKPRDSLSNINGSTHTLVFAAFAENPFRSARAR
jgi:hypothetical protein